MVDLDGAKSQHIVNSKVLYDITTKTNLKVDFGGGLKTNQDVEVAFDCGASQITGGSIAAKNATLFLEWLELWYFHAYSFFPVFFLIIFVFFVIYKK